MKNRDLDQRKKSHVPPSMTEKSFALYCNSLTANVSNLLTYLQPYKGSRTEATDICPCPWLLGYQHFSYTVNVNALAVLLFSILSQFPLLPIVLPSTHSTPNQPSMHSSFQPLDQKNSQIKTWQNHYNEAIIIYKEKDKLNKSYILHLKFSIFHIY